MKEVPSSNFSRGEEVPEVPDVRTSRKSAPFRVGSLRISRPSPPRYRAAFASSDLVYPLLHPPPSRSGYHRSGECRAYPVADRKECGSVRLESVPRRESLDVVALVRGGTILPTYLLVMAYQPLWPFRSHEVLTTLHLCSTLRSFPSPPPPQGWQGPDHCPRSFARRITPSHVRVGTPGHHRVRGVVLLPPLRHFSIDLVDGISILWSHSNYYGDSVTMGLAPVRPSRVPLALNVSSAT